MLKRLLRQLLRAPGGSRDDLVARGRAERERGEPAASLATLETRLQSDAGDAAVLAELGLSYRALGRNEEARAVLERAAASAPDWVLPLLYLGNLAHEAGRLDAALAAYRAALALDRRNASLHYNLALTLTACGEAAAAVEAFRACLAAAPDYADARESLLFALTLSDRAFRMGPARRRSTVAGTRIRQCGRAAAPLAHRLCVGRFLRACGVGFHPFLPAAARSRAL
jgi:tetratricopeptide (TPR) repeat protein